MLEAVKRALDLTTDYYDGEIGELINAALQDMRATAGIVAATEDSEDPLILHAVKLYAQAHFKNPSNYDQLSAAYEALKGSLQKTTGFTDWSDGA